MYDSEVQFFKSRWDYCERNTSGFFMRFAILVFGNPATFTVPHLPTDRSADIQNAKLNTGVGKPKTQRIANP
ncbi:hypothetical protein TI05_17490 [Achromatium sp. WMS3]|nr:hypothetical protein TI05_17490 [Achromatium sp. WMS3]